MKKLIIACVAGLLLGTGVGTAVAYARRPAAPEAGLAADSTAVSDSLAVAHAPGAVTNAVAARFDTEPVPPVGGEAPHEAVPHGNGAHAPASALAAAPASTGAASTATARTAGSAAAGDSTDTARMAQIFGTMKPQEAARVLEKLNDREAEALLLGLTDRKAAAILASLPAERAAALTRSILARNGQ